MIQWGLKLNFMEEVCLLKEPYWAATKEAQNQTQCQFRCGVGPLRPNTGAKSACDSPADWDTQPANASQSEDQAVLTVQD